jgi:hypothetical protein
MNSAPLAFFCATVFLGLGGCHQSSPAAANASAVRTTEHRELSDNELYDLREKCGRDAREWFKQNFPDTEPILVKGGGSVVNQPSGYENHYSRSQNRCYALVHMMMLSSGVKDRIDLFIQSNLLWEVNENAQLGAFVTKGLKEMEITACNVTGAQCTSKDEWMKLAQPYLTD